ncbi:MAG: MFS transporter [Bacillota bacterium]|nr:MFS transporter [Candidatus Fermentithermobacillaceae bacterium]
MSHKPAGVAEIGKALMRPFALGQEYSKLWGGQTLSALTDNITAMALSILVLQRTGSATAASVGLLLQMIPALVFGPVAGVILDRVQRKSVLVVSDMSRALVGLYAAYALHTEAFGLIHVYGWMTVNGIVRAFYDPATNALIPALVDKESIQRANAVHTLGKNTAMILGPAIGGFTLSDLGGFWTLALGSTVFAVSSLLVGAIKPVYEDAVQPAAKRPSLGEAAEGFRFYREVPLAMGLLIMAVLVNLCTMPVGLAFQYHFLRVLKVGSDVLGLGFSVAAVASFVASYLMAMRGRWPRLGLTMASGIGVMALSFGALGMSRSVLQAFIAFVLFGASTPFIQVPMSTLYQEITPPDIRGRVFALRFTVSTFLAPVSTPLVGVGLDRIGSAAVLAILAATLGAVSLGGISARAIREA